MLTLGIDDDGLKRLRAEHPGTDTDKLLAQRIGMSVPAVNRVLRGVNRPGPQFLASIRETFGPQWFVELFKVVDE